MGDHRTHYAQLNIHVLILQSAKMDPIIVLESVLLLDNNIITTGSLTRIILITMCYEESAIELPLA